MRRKIESNRDDATMPRRTPRHLASSRRPHRLLLFTFGLTTAVLAALVASAALVPHEPPPGRTPRAAPPSVPAEPSPTSASTSTSAPRAATSLPAPSTTADTVSLAGDGPGTSTRPTATRAPAAPGGTTTTEAGSTFAATTTSQPVATAPNTTVAPSTTATAPTTTLATTTSAGPTTTGSTTTTTEPATTTTGPVVLRGSQVTPASAAAVVALLPVLGLPYLLRRLLPPGGAHARPRGRHLRRRG
jgi:hypothetical protein